MNKKEEAFYQTFAAARKQYEAENSDPTIHAIKDGDELWDDFDHRVRGLARRYGFNIRLIGSLNPHMQECFDLVHPHFSGAVVSVNLDQFAKPDEPPNVHFFERADDAAMVQLACSQFGELFEAKF